ncbi:hypothetical protein [Agrobacterium sp. El2ro-1b]|uniref:hypothetical protein n=1 Tax=Agrobacterium sp. El2ro-1b TaxID=2969528 RepID=UPI003AAFB580
MAYIRILSTILIFITILGSAFSFEKNNAISGTWRQVRSNSGECGKCSITIQQMDDTFEVVSNNGWRATVKPTEPFSDRELPSFLGSGVWRRDQNGRSSETVLKAVFVYDKRHLHLTMILKAASGEAQKIDVSYRRN